MEDKTWQPEPREVVDLQDDGVLVVDKTTESSQHPGGSETIDLGHISDGHSSLGDKSSEQQMSVKLNQLSLEERNQAILELHGVADVEQETKEMLQEKLSEMSQALDSFGNDAKAAAYRRALEMDRAYVDNKIKLLCLRAESYDVKKATSRVITFFNFKQSLFGEEKLGKEIKLDDLTDKGREALESGVFQLLQQRDRAGRGITVTIGKKLSSLRPEDVMQSFYYVHMSALRDEEIQKTGIAHIYCGIGQENFVSDRPAKAAGIWWMLPVRLVAMHFCYESSLMETAVKLFSQAMEAHHLCRFRSHKGSVLECMFALMTFGIPKEVLPFNKENGDLDLGVHHQWIKTMENREKAPSRRGSSTPELVTSQTKEVVVLGPLDIVVGLGRQSISSAGYVKFRNLLQDNRDEYETADRFEKTVLADLLARKLRDGGCRFIRSTPEGVLSECSEAETRDKISHTYRNMRQQGTRRKGRQTGAAKRSIS